jgi:hypothetical protein
MSVAGTGQTVVKLLQAFSKDRVTKCIEKLTRCCAPFEHSGDLDIISSQIRIAPKGNGKDSYEDLAWVPGPLKQELVLPEMLRSWGCPWILYTPLEPMRFGVLNCPLQGIGQFIVGQSGSALVAIWHMSYLHDMNVPVENALDFWGSLSGQSFTSFTKGQLRWVVVSAGTVLWVPYGWVRFMVTLRTGQPSIVWSQPYVAGSFLAPLDRGVKTVLHDSVKKFQQGTVHDAAYNAVPNAALEWLQSQGITGNACTASLRDSDDEHGSQDVPPSPASLPALLDESLTLDTETAGETKDSDADIGTLPAPDVD